MATYVEQKAAGKDLDPQTLDWVLHNKETGEFAKGKSADELEEYLNKEIQADRNPTNDNLEISFVHSTLELR